MKLTGEVRKRIGQDWARCFPDLGIYKPMWLLRRAGPLLLGVVLERDSGNDSYRPTVHVHCLARPFPAISLTLAQPLLTEKTRAPETIRASFHADRYAGAARRLMGQVSLPLAGEVTLDAVMRAYLDYIQRPISKYPLFLYSDLVLLFAWCRRLPDASRYLDRFANEVKSWPSSILKSVGGFEAWHQECSQAIDDPESISTTVSKEIENHKVAGIPVSDLRCQSA